MEEKDTNEIETEEEMELISNEPSKSKRPYKPRIHLYLQPEYKPIIMNHKLKSEKISHFIHRCIRFTCDYIDNNSSRNIEELKLRLGMLLSNVNNLPPDMSNSTEIKMLQRDILMCDKLCSDTLSALNP